MTDQERISTLEQEVAELRTLVLNLALQTKTLVEGSREAGIILIGRYEDYLGTYYDRSALHNRREKVRQG